MTIPSAPAYVGVYHLLATETLKLFGVDQSAALGYATAMHATTFGTFVLGGLVVLWRRHYTLPDLWRHRLPPLAAAAAAVDQVSSQKGCDQAVRPAVSLASARTQRMPAGGR
jgi:hypothetical protein